MIRFVTSPGVEKASLDKRPVKATQGGKVMPASSASALSFRFFVSNEFKKRVKTERQFQIGSMGGAMARKG
jgi:hypothetical protein